MIITNEYFYWENINMKDSDFLYWLRDRLINVYGEDPHVDFVKTLNDIAKKMEKNEARDRK
jgi:hypothetical protein